MSSITKQFLQQKEARSLLNLGFDEPCIACYNYNNKKKLLFLEEPQTNSELHEYVEDLLKKELEVDNGHQIENFYQIESMFAFTTPTFAQAFDWIREKYKLHSHISLGISDEQDRSGLEYDEYIYVIEGLNGLDYDNYGESLFYKTHEEAELACLRKLISIVKAKTTSI
jgi:hypothetical protein